MAEQLHLADIVGVHGIKGWVKIRSYLEDPALLTELDDIILSPGKQAGAAEAKAEVKKVKVLKVKTQGKGIIAALKGVDDRNAAEALRGWMLSGLASQLPQPGEGEYYWRDLIGLKVWCTEGDREVLLGTVKQLIETGSNDVLVVKPTADSVDDSEHLIPWLPGDVVAGVDLIAGVIKVNWFIDA